MPDEDFEDRFELGKVKRTDDGEGLRRLAGIIFILVIIVIMTVSLNALFPNDKQGDVYDQVEIPQYSVGEYVKSIADGDTFETVEGEWIRLLGMNTEEKGMPNSVIATNRLEQLLNSGPIKMERDIEDKDIYDRYLRYVWAGDVFVNLEMIREGYAHVYVIEPNTKYWDELKAAEQEAIANNRILWQPSAFDVEITALEPVQGAGQDGLNTEAVTFTNVGTSRVTMTNWTVKDEGTRIYKLSGVTLGAGESVTLHSGIGINTNANVYWNRDASVWNNDGDVCFLRDENGLLVNSWRYELEDGEYVWEIH